MTITTYQVHIYERGRYVRTIEKLLSRKAAYSFAAKFNTRKRNDVQPMDFRSSVRPPQRAVVEAVEVPVSPPEFVPATDPLAPGMRPTRRVREANPSPERKAPR